ncbi:cocosin 1-like [Zingiber officinale]|uniref:cocosin 1-like n=1 Tax=Zingiber officinale TaxID=94328 RepID=UPI001C4C64CA|nr:cocosin 1-like [Zingiber officinale]
MSSTAALLAWACALLLLCHCCSSARISVGRQEEREQPYGQLTFQQGMCGIERLSALEPSRRVQSEAGVTEYFDQLQQQMQCAGVSAYRRTIQPRGLLLPFFSNAPKLIYIVQGRCVGGMVIPGCPETFQWTQQAAGQQWGEMEEAGQEQRFRDEHQRIQQYREGDVIAVPNGVAHWFYNNGEVPLVAITISDVSSGANQLDNLHRDFLLAGRERRAEQGAQMERAEERKEVNLLSGFDTNLLAEALGVDREVAKKIQNPEDRRGDIVLVERGLEMLRPSRWMEQQVQQQEEQEERQGQCPRNGLEETYCTLKNKQNMADAMLADYYNPRAGRITLLNSQKLPMLRFIQMSAVRGQLRKNALVAPLWNVNAHSIMYALRGSCRMQVVGHRGRTIFDGELRQGQLLVVPQHFVVVMQSRSEQFEWIAFKTNDNAMVSQVVGKASVLRGLPVEVLMNSYRISREEARRLKFNRGSEMSIFAPKSVRELQ